MSAADSNRVRLTHVREVTLGTTPATPRMRTARLTGESQQYKPILIQSDEFRADRMNIDPIKVDEMNQGGISGEFSFPVDESPLSDWIRSTFFNPWTNSNYRDNDGTADSVITNVAATGSIFTVTTGTAFVAGQLVRATGFTNAGNNGIHLCTTGSATVPAFSASTLTNETAPPAAARLKVVGFQGASGDITATSTGLASTALDFTTLGLAVGQWIKPGGTANASTFAFLVTAGAAARANAWMRITAISATALTCDHLPSGWTTDSGTGKTIKVWFGDRIINGITMTSQSIERGFMSQTPPTYVLQAGMVVNTADFDLTSKAQIKANFNFMGMTGSESTTSVDASPDAATTAAIMTASVNVGRLTIGGSPVAGPNFVKAMKINVNNNLRMIDAIRSDGLVGPVDIGVGEQLVTGSLETYFGSDTLYAQLIAGTVSSASARVAKDSQAVIFTLPRITFTDGSPSAGAKNTDVMLNLNFQGSYDSTTGAQITLDRLEYYEA